MRLTRTGLATLTVLGAMMSGPSVAKVPEQLERAGLTVWAAFQCSVIAVQADDLAERKRLFYFGYEAGKRFYGAVLNGSHLHSLWGSRVPAHLISGAEMPSIEFGLGYAFSNAAADYLYGPVEYVRKSEPLKKRSGGLVDRCPNCSGEERKLMAKVDFRERNCSLIGR